MVVGNFHIASVSFHPPETKTILAVDSDAVLPLPIILQGFELVAGNRGQVAQGDCPVQLEELAKGGFSMARNFFENCCWKTLSVSASRKDRITFLSYIGIR